MEGNTARNNEQRPSWYRSKTGIIIFATLASIIVVSVFVSVSLYGQKLPSTSNLVCFTCYPSSGGEKFSIAVNVNLTDGMDQSEACGIAIEVFDEVVDVRKGLILQSSETHIQVESEIWTVKFERAYLGSPRYYFGHDSTLTPRAYVSFNIVINALNQTVMYAFSISQ